VLSGFFVYSTGFFCEHNDMRVVNVIPISKGILKASLSYFSSEEIVEGSIVEVPLKNKKISAIALGSQNVSDLKSDIKNYGYQLRKIEDVKAKEFFLPGFINSASKTADYFAATTGAVLEHLVPKAVLGSVEKFNINKKIDSTQSATSEKYIIQDEEEKRWETYKILIREEFAKKRSVFVFVPTARDATRLIDYLEKGIKEYSYSLSGSLRPQRVVKIWSDILNEEHPVVIVATGAHLSIPRTDIKTIIIEKENSDAYKIRSRPFLDMRIFAEYLSSEIGASLIRGDILLSTETLWRYKQNELLDHVSTTKMKFPLKSKGVIIDMKTDNSSEKTPFNVFSPEMDELIKHNGKTGENLLILAGRRGLSPLTVCGDCESVVTCNRCDYPLTLHRSKKGNVFICHKCGDTKDPEMMCQNCKSWKLAALGIGSELVEQEMKRLHPDVPIFRLDSDLVKGTKKAEIVVESFYQTPGSVLIGTEMALFYLSKPLAHISIVSIDSLFSVPDFRINERIFRLILNLRSLTKEILLIQTRHKGNPTLEMSLEGAVSKFYDHEIQQRRELDYPPFTTLIKITAEHKDPERVVRYINEAKEVLGPKKLLVFPAFTSRIKGLYRMHALLEAEKDEWPDKKILQKLRSLPPHLEIRVDPDTVL
jgi:primosomal protein N' (replication factor Y) (superfamily II helicase)